MDFSKVSASLWTESNVTLCPKSWYISQNMCYGVFMSSFTQHRHSPVKQISQNDSHLSNFLAAFDRTTKPLIGTIYYNVQDSKYQGTVFKVGSQHSDNKIVNLTIMYVKPTEDVQCELGFYRCADAVCISDLFVCDGQSDCAAGDDESICFCPFQNDLVKDSELCEKNSVTRYKPFYGVFKNMKSNSCIPHYEDKYLLHYVVLSKETFMCNNGETIPHEYQNDLVPDCSDNSDEQEYVQLLNSATAITPKCHGIEISCLKGHSKCFDIHRLCQYDMDLRHELMYCRNGEHLKNCLSFPCSNSYKCSESYCISYSRVCD